MELSNKKFRSLVFEVFVVAGLVMILSSLSAIVTTLKTGLGIWSTDVISIETMMRFSLGLALVSTVIVIQFSGVKNHSLSTKRAKSFSS